MGRFLVALQLRCRDVCTGNEKKITESVNVGKENFTESVNFLNLREKSGLTLAQLAALSGYSVATINGLELNNSGSKRLREKLKAILTENVNSSEVKAPELDISSQNFPATANRFDLAIERIAAALERIAEAIESQRPQ